MFKEDLPRPGRCNANRAPIVLCCKHHCLSFPRGKNKTKSGYVSFRFNICTFYCPSGVPARHGARRSRAEDEQVSRQHHQPGRRDSRNWPRGPPQDVARWKHRPERGRKGQAGPEAGLPQWYSRMRNRCSAIRSLRLHRSRLVESSSSNCSYQTSFTGFFFSQVGISI